MKGRLGRDVTLLQEWLDSFFSPFENTGKSISDRGGLKQVDMQCGKG